MSGLEGLDEGLVQNQQGVWQELDDLQVNVVLVESVVHEGYDTNVDLSSWMSWASSSAKCWFPVWKTYLARPKV